jgi:tRNA(Arg) A34 adenosine deaminase TadA
MTKTEITLRLPRWAYEDYLVQPPMYATVEDRAALTIELARRNVAEKTGGPFGAAVFNHETGRLLSIGLNRVVSEQCSVAHAEIMALGLAQQIMQTHDLGARGMPVHELVSSTEPCAMCLGAIPWSGIRRLVCCAREEDARQIGFDEGDKPADWVTTLERRGIVVLRNVCREDAIAVLEAYLHEGGVIYNGQRDLPGDRG